MPDAVLHVLLGGDEVEPSFRLQLERAAQAEYTRSRARSVTAALRDAVLAAHAVLRDRNGASLPSDRRYLSAACATLRPEGAYVALAGWAYAFRMTPRGRQTFTLGPEPRSRVTIPSLLGSRGYPQVTLRFTSIEPDEVLVLAAGQQPFSCVPSEAVGGGWAPAALAAELSDQGASSVLVLDSSGRAIAQQPPAVALHDGALRDAPAEPIGKEAGSGPRSGPLTVAIGVLLAFLLSLGLWLGATAPSSEIAADLREIRRLVAAAQDAPDRERSLQMLGLAHGLVDRVGRDQVPSELLTELQEAEDRVDRVLRLNRARELAAWDPEQRNVDRMELGGEDLYLLDSAAGEVHLLPSVRFSAHVNELAGNSQIIAPDMPVAADAVGYPLTLAWTPAGTQLQRPLLVVVDTDRTFMTIDPRFGMQRMQPPESDSWAELGPASGAEGAVYLVDSGQGHILRYRLMAPNRAANPTRIPVDGEVDLTKAVALAVSDREIYLLMSEGRVVRLDHAGQQLPFSEPTFDVSLEGPISIAVGQRTNGVYVATSGRVFQFGPDGQFVRQFVPDETASDLRLRDIAVDEAARFLMCLTQGSVVLYDLPGES